MKFHWVWAAVAAVSGWAFSCSSTQPRRSHAPGSTRLPDQPRPGKARTRAAALGLFLLMVRGCGIALANSTSVVVTCPPDVQLQCGDSSDPSVTGTPIAAGCSFTYIDRPGTANCTGQAAIERTWSPSCSQVSFACVQHITFVDQQPPEFLAVPVPDLTVDCSTIPGPVQLPVQDNCDPHPQVEITDTPSAPALDGSYIIIRRWTATDACGNQAVEGQLISVNSCFTPQSLGSICGGLFYDANGDGTRQNGEPGMAGYPIKLTRVSDTLSVTEKTDASGHYCFAPVAPGTYLLSAALPVSGNWKTTTSSFVTINLGAGATVNQDFGGVCLGPGGARGAGFWASSNGARALNDGGSADPELQMLSQLHLRNADGSAFDPGNINQLKAWLDSASAVNMAYGLSAQLASMVLNVEAGYVAGITQIYAPESRSANASGFVAVGAVLSEADGELAIHNLTIAGSAYRLYQAGLKNALDRASNNLSFQPTPCLP
jgi:hypothetical protein